MKDTLGLLALVGIYSIAIFFAGMELERSYVNHLMPNVLAAEFIRGARLGVEIGKNEQLRDELQGTRRKPAKIKVKYVVNY